MKTFKEYLKEESNRKIYYRGTDNPDEENLVKTKTLRPSFNHVNNKQEIGISVSDVPDVKKFFKYMYQISGIEIGEGSDGEPLLDPKSVKFVTWVDKP